MKINMPYSKKILVTKKNFTKNVIILLAFLFILMLGQTIYVTENATNAAELKSMIDQSNTLKIQNQILETKIAEAQSISRIKSVAESKFAMIPAQSVIYINSHNLLSYNTK